ncbi:MAG: mechanosensitive ion channel domain-containing protein [Methylococcaceae bacterium]
MIVKILFFCLSLFSSQLLAVNTVSTLNSVTNNTPSGEKLATLPQAEKLVSGWWDYFNVDEALLAKRIDEVQQQYLSILQTLPLNVKETANSHLHNLITNLKALQELRKPSTIALAKPIVQQAQYSIAQWLNLADELRKAEWELKERQVQLDNEAITLDAAQNRLNTLMLDYIATEPVDSNKLLLGLDIMAKRSAMAVGDEQLKLNKALLEQQRNSVDNLKEVSQNATDKLKTDKDFIQQSELQLQDLEAKVEPTQTAARKALLETLGVIEQTPLALSNSHLRHQQAINAIVDEAALKLQIAKINAEKNLATLLLNKLSDTALFNDALKQWQSQQKLQQQNALNWTKETSDELNQVQDAIIRLSADSGNSDDSLVRLLKQRLKTAQAGLVSLKQMEVDNDELNKLMQEINNRLALHSGQLSIWFDWSLLQLLELKTKVMALWLEPLFTIGDTPVTIAGIVRVIIIIALAALISKLFQRVMRHLTERTDKGEHGHVSVFYTVGRLAHYLILLIGIVIALSSIGLDFTNLALVAGALSVGIGFGLQSIVNNFVSGLILLFEGTIKVGDFIELDATTNGVVREINVRSTQISTPDGIDIIVPNSILASNQVINWTLREANRRIHVPFSVAYGTDKELVKTAALEAAAKVRFTHQAEKGKATQCWLVKFGDNGLHFELVVWINQEAVKKPSMVYAAYLWEIESSLNKYHIEIPFPQRELRLRSIDDGFKFK